MCPINSFIILILLSCLKGKTAFYLYKGDKSLKMLLIFLIIVNAVTIFNVNLMYLTSTTL